jgi:hypothetical protein
MTKAEDAMVEAKGAMAKTEEAKEESTPKAEKEAVKEKRGKRVWEFWK